MGTSSSYGGPSGGGGLLPPWVDDPGDFQSPPTVQSPDPHAPDSQHPNDQVRPQVEPPIVAEVPWSQPKASLTRYASSVSHSRPNANNAAGALRGYVRAQGGASHAASAARAGRSSAVRLGGFLSSLAAQGVSRTVRQYGLQIFLGQPANVLLAGLCDAIAPPGDSLEDSVARNAIVSTLADAFDQYAVNEGGLDALERLDGPAMGEIIERFIAYYTYYRVIEVLAKNLEMSMQTRDVISTEQNVRDFVFASVHLEELTGVDFTSMDWMGSEGTQLIDRLFQEAFSIFENT